MKRNFYVNNFIEENLADLDNNELFIIHTLLNSDVAIRQVKQQVERALDSKKVYEKNYKKLIEKIMTNEKEELVEALYKNLTLNNIQVKNFKGFGDEINTNDKGLRIEFNEHKNIFFAPNGGGKTSLSNALEYGMTGKIKEAKKRGLSINQYINRKGKRHYLDIEMKDQNENVINELNDLQKKMFENAFVEHNRINAFSLLESKDSRDDYRDIISNILGLEELEEFMSFFIKPTSFILQNNKKTLIKEGLNEYKEKKRDEEVKIKILKQYIRDNKKEIFKEITHMHNIKELKTKKVTSRKKNNIKKYLKEIENELKESKITHTKQIAKEMPILEVRPIFKNIAKVKKWFEKYNKLSIDIEEDFEKINLTNLFEAVTKLTEDEYDKCPVCHTNLKEVNVNPFHHAKEELEKLQNLQAKQEEKLNIKKHLENDMYFNVVNIIETYKKFESEYNKINKGNKLLFSKRLLNIKDYKEDKMEFLEYCITFFTKNLDNILLEIQNFEEFKKDYSLEIERIEKEQNKNNQIEHCVDNIKSKLDIWNDYMNDIIVHYNKIIKLKTKNRKNLKEIENENKYNEFIDNVEKSYKNMYEKLLKYRNSKQLEEIKDTEQLILKYYNQINKDDSVQEKINEISFELAGDKYKIMIDTYEGEINAFSKLSEGHLRALGLSIILAIAEKKELPILIFDDIVNAIDAEHRANIIDLLYTDNYLKNTQIIITTHDRLFWERFSMKISSKSFNNSNILEYTNQGIILKQYYVDFDNKIKNALKHYDVRQALIYSRLWFETLAMNYCDLKKHSIKGNIFTKSLIVSMTPNINDMYTKVENEFGTTDQFKIIKKDLINWKGQNQEHHAFDESSYNFVHAKISDEVEEIYQAIRELEIIMFEKKRDKYKNDYTKLSNRNIKLKNRLDDKGFLNNAHEKIINETHEKKEDTKKELKRLEPLIEIIEQIEKDSEEE